MLKFIVATVGSVFFFFSLANAQRDQLDSLHLLLTNVKVDSQKIDIINEIAYQNINVNPSIAKDDVNIAYKGAKELNYIRGQARALVVMGGVYWGYGNYNEALSHYLDALSEFQKLNDLNGRSDCLNNIGEVYKKLGKYENALDYLKHSLTLKEELEGKGNPILVYSNLGELYTLMNQYDLAEENYKIALEGAKRLNNKKVLSYVNDGLGLLFFRNKKYEKAISYFNESVRLKEANRDIRGNSYSYINLGRTYLQLKNADSAEYYLDKGLLAAKQSEANEVKATAYKYIAQLDSLKGDFELAYVYHKLHTQVKDSIFNIAEADRIAQLQTDYEMEILQLDNLTKQTEVKQKNTLIIAVIMLLILAIALANAFYQQRTSQKKANEALTLKNSVIEKKNYEIQKQAVELQDLNDNLANLNQNLEDKIKQRTEMLREQNRLLADYAFVHSHELRAPVANILGLVELLKNNKMSDADAGLIEHLFAATRDLDEVIVKISAKLEEDSDIKSIS